MCICIENIQNKSTTKTEHPQLSSWSGHQNQQHKLSRIWSYLSNLYSFCDDGYGIKGVIETKYRDCALFGDVRNKEDRYIID
jgi:hypothetical protein